MLSSIAGFVRVRGDMLRGDAGARSNAARGEVTAGSGVRGGESEGRGGGEEEGGLRLRGLVVGEGAGVLERGAMPAEGAEERGRDSQEGEKERGRDSIEDAEERGRKSGAAGRESKEGEEEGGRESAGGGRERLGGQEIFRERVGEADSPKVIEEDDLTVGGGEGDDSPGVSEKEEALFVGGFVPDFCGGDKEKGGSPGVREEGDDLMVMMGGSASEANGCGGETREGEGGGENILGLEGMPGKGEMKE